jgi:hypothetical protein
VETIRQGLTENATADPRAALVPVVLARLAVLKNDGRAALATLPSKLKVARCTRTGGPSYLSLGQRKTRAECSIEELLVLRLPSSR